MQKLKKFFHVSWSDIQNEAAKLSHKLKGKRAWKGIIAVTRGGLIPATTLAREMDIYVIETIGTVGYDPRDLDKKPLPTITLVKEAPSYVGDGDGWLVVDDLVDSGRTLRFLRQILPKAYYATIYAKPDGEDAVDEFVSRIDQNVWVYFPWEIDEWERDKNARPA